MSIYDINAGYDEEGLAIAPFQYKGTLSSHPLKSTSKYDRNMPYGVNPDLWRAQEQGTWDRVLNGTGRLLGTTATKMLEGFGYLGGLIYNDNYDEQKGWIAGAADNAFSEIMSNAEDWIKEQLPIYKTKYYEEGNVFQQMGTLSFWMDDVVDGVAFMLSAFVPGVALSKLGMGAKFAKAMQTANKTNKYFEEVLGMARIKPTQRMFDVLTTSALATTTESMFEAKDVKDSITSDLMQIDPVTGKRKINPQTGKIYTDDEIKLLAADAARRTFQMNMAALAISNTIEAGFLFKKLPSLTGGMKVANKLGDQYTKESLRGFARYFDGFAAKTAGRVGKGIAAEGLWEENIQYSIQNLNQAIARSGVNDSHLFEGLMKMPDAAFSMADLDDPERMKNIVLGGIIGGGMGLGSSLYFRAAEKKSETETLKDLNTNLNALDIYKKTGGKDIDITKKDGKYYNNGNEITAEEHKELSETYLDGKEEGKAKTPEEVLSKDGMAVIDPVKLDAVIKNNHLRRSLLDIIENLDEEDQQSEVLGGVVRHLFHANLANAHFRAGTTKSFYDELNQMRNITPEELEKLRMRNPNKAELAGDINYWINQTKILEEQYNTIALGVPYAQRKSKQEELNKLSGALAMVSGLYHGLKAEHNKTRQRLTEHEANGSLDAIAREINKAIDRYHAVNDRYKAKAMMNAPVSTLTALQKESERLYNEALKIKKDNGYDENIEHIATANPSDKMIRLHERKLSYLEDLMTEQTEQWSKLSDVDTGLDYFQNEYVNRIEYPYATYAIKGDSRADVFKSYLDMATRRTRIKNDANAITSDFFSYAIDERLRTEEPDKIAEDIILGKYKIYNDDYSKLLGRLILKDQKVKDYNEQIKSQDAELAFQQLEPNDVPLTLEERLDAYVNDPLLAEGIKDPSEEYYQRLVAMRDYVNNNLETQRITQSFISKRDDITSERVNNDEEVVRRSVVEQYFEETVRILKLISYNKFYQDFNEIEEQIAVLKKLKELVTDEKIKSEVFDYEKQYEFIVNETPFRFNASVVQSIDLQITMLEDAKEEAEKRAHDNLLKDQVSYDNEMEKKFRVMDKGLDNLEITHEKTLEGYQILADTIKKASNKEAVLATINDYLLKTYDKLLKITQNNKIYYVTEYFENPAFFINNIIAKTITKHSGTELSFAEYAANNEALKDYMDSYDAVALLANIDRLGLNDEAKVILSELLNIHLDFLSAFELKETIESNYKLIEVYNRLKAYNNSKDKAFSLTREQLISMLDLVKHLSRDITHDSSAFNLLLGLIGTGKTTVELRWLLEALGIKDSEVLFTAGRDESAKLVGGDSAVSWKSLTTDEITNVLKGKKLIVIDEVNALEHDEYTQIYTAISNYNKTVIQKVRVLLMGDATQIRGRVSNSSEAYSPFTSFETGALAHKEHAKNMGVAKPLTVRNRSYIPAINNFVDIFHRQSKDLRNDEIAVQINHTNIDSTKEPLLGVAGVKGGQSAFISTIRNILDNHKDDNRTRLVITNTTKVEQYRELLKDYNVKVLSAIDSVGYTVDEVYTDIENEWIDTLDYNSAVYTVVGRARKFALVGGFNLKNVETTVKENEEIRRKDNEEREKWLDEYFDRMAKMLNIATGEQEEKIDTEEKEEETPKPKKESVTDGIIVAQQEQDDLEQADKQGIKTDEEKFYDDKQEEEDELTDALSQQNVIPKESEYVAKNPSYLVFNKETDIDGEVILDPIEEGDEVIIIKDSYLIKDENKDEVRKKRVGIYRKVEYEGRIAYQLVDVVSNPNDIPNKSYARKIKAYLQNDEEARSMPLRSEQYGLYGYSARELSSDMIIGTGKVTAGTHKLAFSYKGQQLRSKKAIINKLFEGLDAPYIDRELTIASSYFVVFNSKDIQNEINKTHTKFRLHPGHTYLKVHFVSKKGYGEHAPFYILMTNDKHTESSLSPLKDFLNLARKIANEINIKDFRLGNAYFNELMYMYANGRMDQDIKRIVNEQQVEIPFKDFIKYKYPALNLDKLEALKEDIQKLVALADKFTTTAEDGSKTSGKAQNLFQEISNANASITTLILKRYKRYKETNKKGVETTKLSTYALSLLNTSEQAWEDEQAGKKLISAELYQRIRRKRMEYIKKELGNLTNEDYKFYNEAILTNFINEVHLEDILSIDENGESNTNGGFGIRMNQKRGKVPVTEDIISASTRFNKFIPTRVVMDFTETIEEIPETKETETVTEKEETSDERDRKLRKLFDSTEFIEPEFSDSSKVGTEKITKDKALKYIRKYLPGISERNSVFFSNTAMLRNALGEERWGYIKDKVIYLSTVDNDMVYDNVLRHEVFHYIFNYYLTPEERKEVLDFGYNEETLANMFMERRNDTSYRGKLYRILRKIAELLRLLPKHVKSIEDFFRRIERGYYSTVYDNIGVERSLIKRSDMSYEDHIKAKNLVLNMLRRVTKGSDTIKEDDDIPLSFDEAVNVVKLRLYDLLDTKVAEYAEKSRLARIILSKELSNERGLYDQLVEELYPATKIHTQRMGYKVEEQYIDDETEDDTEDTVEDREENHDISKYIRENDSFDQSDKANSRVKNFLYNITSPDGKKLVRYNYAFMVLAQYFSGMSFNNHEGIVSATDKIRNTGLYGKWIANAILELNEKFTTHAKYKGKEIQDAVFINDIFYYGKGLKLSGLNSYEIEDMAKKTGTVLVKIHKPKKSQNVEAEYTEQIIEYSDRESETITTKNYKKPVPNNVLWFNLIANRTSLDINLVKQAYDKEQATITLAAVVSYFSSVRLKNYFNGQGSYRRDQGGYDKEYYPVRSQDIRSVEERNLAERLEEAYKDKKEWSKAVKKYQAPIEDKTSNEEVLKRITDFLNYLGYTNVNITEIDDVYQTLNKVITGISTAVTQQALITDGEDISPLTVTVYLEEEQKGRMHQLSKLMERTNESYRNSMIKSPDGKSRWRITLGSFVSDVITFLKRRNIKGERKFITYKEYFDTPFFKKNIFVTKEGIKNEIYQEVDHNGIINKEFVKEYKRESPKNFLDRELLYQFATGDGTYYQSIYVVNDKPQLFAFQVNRLNSDQIDAALKNAIVQEMNRPLPEGAHKIANYEINYLKSSLPGIDEYVREKGKVKIIIDGKAVNMETAIKKVREEILYEKEAILTELLELGLPQTTKKSNWIDSFNEKKAEFVPQSKKSRAKISEEGRKEYEGKVKSLYDGLVESFLLNNAVNSYFLTQLFIGDQAQYINSYDITKRLDTVFAEGQKGAVNKALLPLKYRAVVAEDARYVADESLLKELRVIFGDDINSTDGFAFMSKRRFEAVKRSTGYSMKLTGNIKGVYAGIDSNGVNRGIKYSDIVLSDHLTRMFPQLKRIHDWMEEHDIDEFIFSNAFKFGNPVEQVKFAPLTKGKKVLASHNLKDFDVNLNVIELDSNNWRIQLIPHAPLSNSMAAFSQLIYKINENGKNQKREERIHELLGLHVRHSMDQLDKKIENKVDNFRAAVAEESDMVTYDHRNIELLTSKTDGTYDVSVNMPSITNKIISRFINYVGKTSLVRFKGAPMVLQSIYGTQEISKEQKLKQYGIKREPKFINNEGYTECYLPNIYKDKVRVGEFITDDVLSTMLAYRLPSTGLHSALALKVIGFLETDDNVVIVPAEIVALMGSDYDIDELQVIRFELFDDNIKIGDDYLINRNKISFDYKGSNLVSVLKSIVDNGYFMHGKKKITFEKDDIKKARKALPIAIRNEILSEFLDTLIDPKLMLDNKFPIMFDRIERAQERLNKHKEMLPTKYLMLFGDRRKVHQEIWSGDALIGIIAKYAKGYHYARDYSFGILKEGIKILKDGDEYTYDTLSRTERVPDKDGQLKDNKITIKNSLGKVTHTPMVPQTLDSLINIVIDRHNFPYLFNMNITRTHIDSLLGLISMGVDIDTALNIINSPVADLYTNNTKAQVDKILEEYLAVAPEAVSFEDIEEAIGLDFNSLTDEQKAKQVTVWAYYTKAAKLGGQINTVANAMASLRGFPSDYSQLVGRLAVFDEIYKDISRPKKAYIKEDGSDNANTPAKRIYRTYDIGVEFELRDSWLLEDMQLIMSPYIREMYNTLVFIKDKSEMFFAKLDPKIGVIVDEVIESLPGFAIKNNTNTRERVADEFVKAVVASLNIEELAVEDRNTLVPVWNDYGTVSRHEVLTGVEAWLNDTAEKIRALKKADKNNEVINKFLELLQFRRDNHVLKIGVPAFQNLKINDIINIERDFEKLPEDIQDDLVKYAALQFGMGFGSRNYSLFIPPHKLKSISVALDNKLNALRNSPEELQKLKGALTAVVAKAHVAAVKSPHNKVDQGSYTRMENIAPIQQNDHNWGVDVYGNENVYYSVKFDKTELTDPTQDYPLYINYNERLYVRLKDKDEYKYAYYRLFSRSKEYHYPRQFLQTPNYNPHDYFKADVHHIYVKNKNSNEYEYIERYESFKPEVGMIVYAKQRGDVLSTEGKYKVITAIVSDKKRSEKGVVLELKDVFTAQQKAEGYIKEGVPELFESNPELANAVYEVLGFNNNVVFETERGSIYYLNNGKTKRDKKTSTGRIEKFSESDKTVYITEEDFKTLRESSEGLSDLEWTDDDVTVTNDSGRKTTISISNTPKIGLLPLELVKGIDETESGYREDKRINIKSYSFLPKGVSFHVGHKIISINNQITPQQSKTVQEYKKITDKLQNRFGIKTEYYTNETDRRKGYILGNTSYINTAYMTPDTPFHEVIHPFIELLYRNNPALYNELKAQLSLEQIERVRKYYPELDEESIFKEAMVQSIGEYAANYANKEISGVIKKILEYIMSVIESLLNGIRIPNTGISLEKLGMYFALSEGKLDLTGTEIKEQQKANSYAKAIQEDNIKRRFSRTKKGEGYEYTLDGKPVTALGEFLAANITSEFDLEKAALNEAKYKWAKYGGNIRPGQEVPDEKETIRIDKTEYTFKELISISKKQRETARQKGNIFHAYVQMMFTESELEREQIKRDIDRMAEAKPGIQDEIKLYEFEQFIRDRLGYAMSVNLYVKERKDIAEKDVDTITPEVSLYSELFEIATTIDLMVERHNGNVILLEHKSGNKFYNDMHYVDRIMKYAEDNEYVSLDTNLNRAYLSLVLRAMMLKEKFPSMRFEKLAVDHYSYNYRDESYSINENHPRIGEFLFIIKAYAKDKMPDKYEKMKDLGLFEENNYYGQPMSISQILEDNKVNDTDALIKKLQHEIELTQHNIADAYKKLIEAKGNHNTNEVAKYNNYISSAEKNIEKLTQDVTFLMSKNADILEENVDASWFKRHFGNWSSIRSQFLQVVGTLVGRSQTLAKKEINDFNQEYDTIIRKVLREYEQEHGKVRTVVGKVVGGINTEKFWSSFFKEVNTLDGTIRHLKDPSELTGAKKELVEFINQKLKKELWRNTMDVNYYSNVYKQTKKYDLMSEFKTDTLPDWWFPITPVTPKEIADRSKSGLLSKTFLARIYNQNVLFFEDNAYNTKEEKADPQTMPVKYLGNPILRASDSYSIDLEDSVKMFAAMLIKKKYNDPLMAYLNGVKGILKAEDEMAKRGVEGKHLQTRNIGFVEDRIKLDILNISNPLNLKNKNIRWPVLKFTKTVDKEGKETIKPEFKMVPVNMDKLLLGFKNYVTYTTMWLKPVTAGFNTALIIMLNTKEAMKGSLVQKFGADPDDINFTLKDLILAERDYFKMVHDQMMGRPNKLFDIAKELQYLTDNYDYAIRNDYKVVSKSKIFQTNNLFIFHRIGEDHGNFVLLAAQLRHMKNKKTGKSMWDSYGYNKDGKLEWQGGQRGYLETGHGVREALYGLHHLEVNRLKRISQKIQGGYRSEERVALELHVLGKWALQFKKYMPAYLENIFQGKYKDFSLGKLKMMNEKTAEGMDVYEFVPMMNVGQLWVVLGALSHIHHIRKHYKELEPIERQQLAEALIVATMFLTWTTTKGLFFDDDDKKKYWYIRINRLLGEDITQGFSPIDLARNLQTQTVLLPRAYKTMDAIWDIVTEGMIEGRRTRKGDVPGWKTLQKNIPIFSIGSEIDRYFGEESGFEELKRKIIGTEGLIR